MKEYITVKSQRFHEEAKQFVTDGVGSYFHIPSYRDYPIAMTHGKGSKLYDLDGNEYIDYVLGFGPMLLGHCPPAVNDAVERQLTLGTQFSAPTPDLVNLAKRLTGIIPSAETVCFQNSGTEVVMYALRLARAYTGKYKIVKFEGQYHGWSDEEKISIDADSIEELGERSNPNKIIHTRGQRLSSADDLFVLPWNDAEILENLLARHHSEIAAVIMEPVMFDSGPILPKEGYLQNVREMTEKYGILLIFDEVITGFRMSLGGAQAFYGITPDISTFAKAISSGYPFGVVAGKKAVMNCGIHASGTYNGNPLGTAAALATIQELSKPGVYEHLNRMAELLEQGFRVLSDKYKLPIYTRHLGSIFILFFGFTEDPEDFRDWLDKADTSFYQKFIARSEAYGIRYTDRRGREYLSTVHTEEDIAKTLEVADQVFREIL
jgi:glutamate-1-semialdehyde 2,1-aminomutase